MLLNTNRYQLQQGYLSCNNQAFLMGYCKLITTNKIFVLIYKTVSSKNTYL